MLSLNKKLALYNFTNKWKTISIKSQVEDEIKLNIKEDYSFLHYCKSNLNQHKEYDLK